MGIEVKEVFWRLLPGERLAPEVAEDDILHLISESPELGAPKTADGNGIGAHGKSTHAAGPSPHLPFDPVG